MIYVLDTNAWSDALRGIGRIGRKLSVAPVACVRLAAPVLYELRRGAAQGPAAIGQAIDRLASTYAVAGFDQAAAEAAARLAADMRRQGRQIHHLDALVAGIALAQNATLVTRDHAFSAAAGLAIEDWTA